MKRIKLKDYFKNCSTREKGRKFYIELKQYDTNEYEFDFSDILHVSTSFLDESLWKLASEGKKVIICDPNKLLEEKLHLIQQWRDIPVEILKQENCIHLEYSRAI